MALIRRGADVAQVTFTPAGKYDITQKTFKAMADQSRHTLEVRQVAAPQRQPNAVR